MFGVAFLQKTDFSDNPETAASRALDSHVTDIVEEKNPSPDEEKRLRRRRAGLQWAAGLGIAVVVGVVAVVAIRTQLAEIIAKDVVKARSGAPLTVTVSQLGPGGGTLEGVALGSPGGPGVKVGRADVAWRFDPIAGRLDITRLVLTDVEVRAAIGADGALDLGPIAPFLSPSDGPSRVRLNGLEASGVMVRLTTPEGAASARVAASGGETAGWSLIADDMTLPPGVRASASAEDAGRIEALLKGRKGSAIWTADALSLALGGFTLRGLTGEVRLGVELGEADQPTTVRLLRSRLQARDATGPGFTVAGMIADLRGGAVVWPKEGLQRARLDLDARISAGRMSADAVRLRGAGVDAQLSRCASGAIRGSGLVFASEVSSPAGTARNVRMEATPLDDLVIARPDAPSTLQGSVAWRLEADRTSPAPGGLAAARASLAAAGGSQIVRGHLDLLDAVLSRLGSEGVALSSSGILAFKGARDLTATLANGATATGAGLTLRADGPGERFGSVRWADGTVTGAAAGTMLLSGPDGLNGRLAISRATIAGGDIAAAGSLRIGPWTVDGRTATLAADTVTAALQRGVWRFSAAGGARWEGPDLDAAVTGARATLSVGAGRPVRGQAVADVRFKAQGSSGATRIEAGIGAGNTRIGRFSLATPFGDVAGDGVVVSTRGGVSTARTAGCLVVRPAAATSGAQFDGPLRLCPDGGGLQFGAGGGAVSGWVETPAAALGVGTGTVRVAPARLRMQTRWRGAGRDFAATAEVLATDLAAAAADGSLQGLDARAAGLQTRIDATGAGWTATGALTGADVSIAGVRLAGGGAFAATSVAGEIGAEATDLDLTLTDGAEAARFAPMRAAGSMIAAGGLVDGAMDVTLAANGVRIGTLDILHDLPAGSGGARFTADRIVFERRGLQPDAIAPLLEGLVANADGAIEATAEALWAPDAPLITTGRLATAGIDFATGVGPFERVSGAVELTDLLAIRSAPNQTVRVGRFNPGLPIDDGDVSFSLPGGLRIALESARWPFAGGTLALKPDEWVIGAARQDLAVDVIGVDLGRFLELARIPDLTVTGSVNGRFPIVVEDTIARIEGGRLIAEGAGGAISYTGPAAQVASQNAGAKLAFDALANLRYRVLEIGVDGPLTGDLSLKFLFEGANPDVMSGYPIRFNLGATGPFAQLARALGGIGARGQAIGEQVRDEIERQQRQPVDPPPRPAP